MVRKSMQKNLGKISFNIAILYGATRRNRQGIRFVNYISKQIKNNGHRSQIIDPLHFKLPLLDKRYADFKKSKAPEAFKKVHKILDNAHSYLLSKNLMPDYFELRDSELNLISKNNFEGDKIFLGSVTINNTRLIDNIEF